MTDPHAVVCVVVSEVQEYAFDLDPEEVNIPPEIVADEKKVAEWLEAHRGLIAERCTDGTFQRTGNREITSCNVLYR